MQFVFQVEEDSSRRISLRGCPESSGDCVSKFLKPKGVKKAMQEECNRIAKSEALKKKEEDEKDIDVKKWYQAVKRMCYN